MRLSSHRSQVRANQNARITWASARCLLGKKGPGAYYPYIPFDVCYLWANKLKALMRIKRLWISYLVKTVTRESDLLPEITRMIALGWAAFNWQNG